MAFMGQSNEPTDLVITKAKPRFFARVKEELYWLSESRSRVVIVLADRQAAVELHRQIGQVLGLSNQSESLD